MSILSCFFTIYSLKDRYHSFNIPLEVFTIALGSFLMTLVDVESLLNYRLIIQYIEGRGPQETWRGYILAFGLFIVATAQSMFLHQYFDKAVIVGLRARSAILGIVYRKV